ncbi:helix-turn-helix domain-containing protein [Nocardiopsis salina]|uniref:helix-turn-helix domain-containing protein n=1 Tax=Nocardiopsis salina TaxID=245836 RepID=UPI000592EB01|nr:XRE family transcriptional regulator [Nocardiopsis salina]
MTSRLQDIATLFDGGRLTLARNLAGLRKNALAAAIGKSPTAVAAYENGAKRPAATTVAELSLALQVDPGFFLPRPGKANPAGTPPHFRSLRSTTQLARDQAHAYGQLVVDVAAGIERHVEFPERDLPAYPIAGEEPDHGAPEEAASCLRKDWNLPEGPVGHLVRLAENHGCLVVFTPRGTAKVDAYSFDTLQRPVVLLNPLKDDYFRQRFDVAHELGHLVMHLDAEPGGRVVENQANRFASELLMPADQIIDQLPPRADWKILQRLKQYWNVSLQALLFRARTLGVMGEVTYRNAVVSLSQKGWRRSEPGPMPILEQPSLLPGAAELLRRDAGVEAGDLSEECGSPIALFTTITSRFPQPEDNTNQVAADADQGRSEAKVISLLEHSGRPAVGSHPRSGQEG